MKKVAVIICLALCIFTSASCRPDLNYIISYKPSIEGLVLQVTDSSVLIENSMGQYWVSTSVEYSDGKADLSVGDTVEVFYDGTIAESYPMQIHKVYAIFLIEPENREDNDKS